MPNPLFDRSDSPNSKRATAKILSSSNGKQAIQHFSSYLLSFIDWQKRDAAKRIYRAFKKPNQENQTEVNDWLRDISSQNPRGQQQIANLLQTSETEEALNELNEAASVRCFSAAFAMISYASV